MNLTWFAMMLLLSAAAPDVEDPVARNHAYKALLEQGVKMSDGTAIKLRTPIMGDGLDAAGQRAAITEEADDRATVDELVAKTLYAPVMTTVRTVKAPKNNGPAVRTVDVWFIARGDWNTLTSKDFLESILGAEEKKGKRSIVSKSGTLTDEEMQKRKLTGKVADGYEERFLYTTFALFEEVQVSVTRFSVLTKDQDVILAAGTADPRFDKDAEYPNRWRPLLRDAQAEIVPGPARRFAHAGGYAKITRLKEPADAAFVECHLVYEEPYAWFEGVNLVKQRLPVMIKEKIRTFRRKLSEAGQKKEQP